MHPAGRSAGRSAGSAARGAAVQTAVASGGGCVDFGRIDEEAGTSVGTARTHHVGVDGGRRQGDAVLVTSGAAGVGLGHS